MLVWPEIDLKIEYKDQHAAGLAGVAPGIPKSAYSQFRVYILF